jgi:hypothetical protein
LGRIIKTARFAEMTRAFSIDELATFLAISTDRAEIIADLAIQIGLLDVDDKKYCETPACSAFLKCARSDDRANLNRFMMNYSMKINYGDILHQIIKKEKGNLVL